MKHYGSVTERYGSIMEHYGSVVHHYGTLQNITKHCGMLRNEIEVLRKCYGVLPSFTEHHRALVNITGCYGMLQERYGALTVWNITES